MEKKPEETKDETTMEEAETPAARLVAELREAGAPEGLTAALVVESEALHWAYLTAHAVANRLLDDGIIAKMDASKIEGQLCQLIYMKMQVSVQQAGPQLVEPVPMAPMPPPGHRR